MCDSVCSQNFDSIFSVATSLLINCEIIYWGKVLRKLRDLTIGSLQLHVACCTCHY